MNSREETATLIARYYEAFNRGDTEAMLSWLADDVAHDINQGGRDVGKQAFRDFLSRIDAAYSERLEDIYVMVNQDGTRAAAEFVVHGVYKRADEGLPPATGQSYVLPAGAFFAVEAGLIRRVSVYYNLAEWIAQVS